MTTKGTRTPTACPKCGKAPTLLRTKAKPHNRYGRAYRYAYACLGCGRVASFGSNTDAAAFEWNWNSERQLHLFAGATWEKQLKKGVWARLELQKENPSEEGQP